MASDDRQETTDDIIESMERFANRHWMHDEGQAVREFANRIKAAWKRDEECAVEHATRHAEAVARDNCRDCIHNPNGKNYEPVGNAAAMREALIAIEAHSKHLRALEEGREDWSGFVYAAINVSRSALAVHQGEKE